MLKRIRSRTALIIAAVLIAIVGVVVLTTVNRPQRKRTPAQSGTVVSEAAPADLGKLRPAYQAAMKALQENDGAEAVRLLSSFDFGSRPVEEYRLYYLANGHQLAGNAATARRTLATLWRRTPAFIYAADAAFNLADLYATAGDWTRNAEVYASLGRSSSTQAVSATARWNAATAMIYAGDPSAALFQARSILISSPTAPEADQAAALVRTLTETAEGKPLPLTASERLDRATAMIEAGKPDRALSELEALERDSPQLRASARLQRGIALHRMGRASESNALLEPLTSGPFKYAVPALRIAARNYAAISASIDPTVTKVVKERKRVGTQKVKVGKGKKRKTVTRPRYQTVSRTVKLVDLAKKNKKEETDRLASERLKDLLLIKTDDAIRLETLNALIARAQAKKQDAYLQELVRGVVALDPQADPALQHFWDKGWAAWARGDVAGAAPVFRFIRDTYTHVNVRRQAAYWYARSIERQGKRQEAAAIYTDLAAAPYADIYAVNAVARGAKRVGNDTNPLKKEGDDWTQIAERQMPQELRLAFELTSLASMREAMLEIRANARPGNVRFAEALYADVYHSTGNELLMYRSLRKAWPQLATVEQDSTPKYFLRMYYPIEYSDEIEKNAKKNELDPNLVRALILQESYYNPEAKSRVGATGLMQLMPATARDHALRLAIPFPTMRLENPSVNIQLGTYHLRMLMRMFGGNTPLVIASYNAGQGNVMKWRRAAPRRPMDEFVEAIPFQETRNYVKRVTLLRSSYARMTR